MEYIEIDKLVKLADNPRQITTESLAKLVQSIRENPEYFEARPIICSDRTGELVIIGGNMRYEASLFLGLSKVPVCILSGLTEQKEREITIRDNVNNGAWDWDKLANEWDSVDLNDWGVNVWMPDESDETKKVNKGDENSEWVDMPEFEVAKKDIKLVVHFESEQHREDFVSEHEISVDRKQNNQWIVKLDTQST